MLKPVDERIELVFVQMDTLKQQLAAMTRERDEALRMCNEAVDCHNITLGFAERQKAELATAQARVKELEGYQEAWKNMGVNLEQCIDENAQLHKALAAREARIIELEAEKKAGR